MTIYDVRDLDEGTMSTPVLASALRANIYKMLDRVIETAESIEVRRGDRAVRIVPVEKPSRLQALPAGRSFAAMPRPW